MRVRQIDTEHRRDVSRFVRFPFDLYRDNPFWVPPFIADMERILNRAKHPYYQHSDADFYLAEEGDRVLGRLCMMENRVYNDFNHSKMAQFGYLEMCEDDQVAAALFEAAFAWGRARGLNEISGPWGVLRSDGSGVLVEGFDRQPAMGIPYNLPYYDRLLAAQGFQKDHDSLSGFLVKGHHLPERFFEIAERVKQKRGFSIKLFASKDELRAWVPRVAEIYRQAFVSGHGFAPPTNEEAALFADDIIAIADLRLIKLVLKDEQIIGFLLAYPNITRGIQRARGRMWPLGWYHLLREQRRTKHVDINGIGLLPAYQGLGANAVLYTEVTKSLIEFDTEYADIVQVSEDNFKSYSDMESIGVKWNKVHRHYRRSL
jgi:hypothetical protein